MRLDVLANKLKPSWSAANLADAEALKVQTQAGAQEMLAVVKQRVEDLRHYATQAKVQREEAQMKIDALLSLANQAKRKWELGELDTALKLLPKGKQTQAGAKKALRAAQEELEAAGSANTKAAGRRERRPPHLLPSFSGNFKNA